MIPLPLITAAKLVWKFRKWIGYALVVIAVVWVLLAYRHSLIESGRAEVRTEWTRSENARNAREAKATADHNAKLAQINEAHNASELQLQAQLATALARPATRTIRVPVSSCTPVSPGHAEVPEATNPAGGFVEVHDTGYDSFRVWLLHYAAGPGVGGGTDAPVPAGR